MALVELRQKSGDGDFLRAVAEAVLQILMEADVEGLIGAGRHERSVERLNYRNGLPWAMLRPWPGAPISKWQTPCPCVFSLRMSLPGFFSRV
jgi:hypothetical protein